MFVVSSGRSPEDGQDQRAEGEERGYGENGNLTLQEFQDQLDSTPCTVFISGYGNLSEEEFARHYRETLDEAIARGDRFVMAQRNAPAENMALAYLTSQHLDESRLTLYSLASTQGAPQPMFGATHKVKHIVGTEEDRDVALTDDSEEDILWLRAGDEQSTWGFSAADCLDRGFVIPVKENARRRMAQDIEAAMDAYDQVA